MKFSRVVGNIDEKLTEIAEKKLSKVVTDLAVRYDNKNTGTKLGGDPFIFSLIKRVQHVGTMALQTAATDGKKYN